MKDLKKYRRLIEQRKGQLNQLESLLEKNKKKLKKLKKSLKASEKAHAVIQIVSKQTQEKIKLNLIDIVSTALSSVFENPYKLDVDFISKRNKIEVDMFFERDGKRINPMSASGFGAVDIASLALLFTCWALQKQTGNETRNTIILDEPLKWLKGSDYPEKGAQIIHQLSHRLGIQIIMTNHDPKLIDAADKIFKVRQSKSGISKVEVL